MNLGNSEKIIRGFFLLKIKSKHYLINCYPFQIYSVGSRKHACELADGLRSNSDYKLKSKNKNYFSLELIFTTACNLACTYCYAKENNTGCYGLELKNMSLSVAKKALDFSFANIVKSIKATGSNEGTLDLYFMGGEPLINENRLIQTLEYVNYKISKIKEEFDFEIKVVPAISTNGVLIRDKVAKIFKKYNFGYVGITIDGMNHDSYRKYENGTGTLSDIVRSISLLSKYKVNIKILSVVSPGEVKNIGKNLLFFKKLNILSKACRVSIIPRAPSLNELHRSCSLPQKDLIKILSNKYSENYSELDKKNFSKMIVEVTSKFKIDERDLGKKMIQLMHSGGSEYHCPAAMQKITVTPDGRIYPCHQLVNIDRFYMGNINKIYKIKTTAKYKNIVKIFKKRVSSKIDKCKECYLQSICPPLVDCPARSYFEEKSFYRTAQYCEMYFPYMNKLFVDHLKKIEK